jgi:hypothetical protein
MQTELKAGAIAGMLSLAVVPVAVDLGASDRSEQTAAAPSLTQEPVRAAQVFTPEPTPARPAPRATPTPSRPPEKKPAKTSASRGRLPWKWLFLGTAAADAGVGGYLLLRNEAPTAGAILYAPVETGIAGVSDFEFRAQGARDPEGKTLSYSWDFGDGTSANGSPAKHRFNQAGSFRVVLTVSDGKKKATTEDTLVVRSLVGHWTGKFLSWDFTMDLTQNGAELAGTYQDRDGSGTVRVVVVGQRSLEMHVTQRQFAELVFSGTVDSSAAKITGFVLGQPFTMSR